MAGPSAELIAAAHAIARGLEHRGVDYAIGGAIAYGAWAVPRATVDLDLTVYLAPDGLTPAIEALAEAGCPVQPAEAAAAGTARGDFRTTWREWRVDVFVPSIPFYEAARSRRSRIVLGGVDVWIWQAEVITVFKMLFNPPKDRVDIERLLAVMKGRLDMSFVRHWLVETVGEGDERVRTWDALVTAAG